VGTCLTLAGHSQRSEACFLLAQLFLGRWAGSLAAAGIWAQPAPAYPSLFAGSPGERIRQWFPAPLLCQWWEGRAFTWHLVLLRLSGQLQAGERAGRVWASLGDRASPARADRVPASAGAAGGRWCFVVGLCFHQEQELGLGFGLFQLRLKLL